MASVWFPFSEICKSVTLRKMPNLPETLRKRAFPHQRIKLNFAILRSVNCNKLIF